MRAMRCLVLPGVICGAVLMVPVFAHELEKSGTSDECDAYSQAGMRECLLKKSHNSTAASRKAETSAADAISNWDEDAKYIATAKTRLKESIQSFEQFRRAQCGWAVSLGGGAIGNALDLLQFRCVNDLNIARAEQLKTMVENLPAK